MNSASNVCVTAAAEGNVDKAAVLRLIEYAGAFPGPIHGGRGKPDLRKNIAGYNNAARYNPWLVVVDLHNEAPCAPPMLTNWIGTPAEFLCFRIVIKEIEVWLLADRENISNFLRVSKSRIPADPESLVSPKRFMVDLARDSRNPAITEDMVPRPGSKRVIGPAYNSRLIEFITSPERGWRPDAAARHSDSLNRALRCLQRLIQKWQNRN